MIGNYVILLDGSPKSALNRVVNRVVGWEPTGFRKSTYMGPTTYSEMLPIFNVFFIVNL